VVVWVEWGVAGLLVASAVLVAVVQTANWPGTVVLDLLLAAAVAAAAMYQSRRDSPG
jgi:hypothetical protein